jgi:hypothetical protein
LKGQCPDNKIPKGLLLDSNAMNDGKSIDSSSYLMINLTLIAISSFNNAKKADLVNEKRPEF